jgi:hypothetical protein
MFIEQRQSVGRTYDQFNRKRAKLFLFNYAIPANIDGFGYDSSNRLTMFQRAVAALDVEFSINDLGNFVIKNDPNSEGVYFTGSGPDVANGTHWLIPEAIGANFPDIDFAEILPNALSRSFGVNYGFYPGVGVTAGIAITQTFDQTYDFDGLDYRFDDPNNFADFNIEYFDGSSWNFLMSVTNATPADRIAFASTVQASGMRITFTASSTNALACDWLLFYSNNTSPSSNFNATQPVEWGALVFDPTGSAVDAVLDERPMVWFNVGEPLAPSTATLDSTTIKPGERARLIHGEFSADIMENV